MGEGSEERYINRPHTPNAEQRDHEFCRFSHQRCNMVAAFDSHGGERSGELRGFFAQFAVANIGKAQISSDNGEGCVVSGMSITQQFGGISPGRSKGT